MMNININDLLKDHHTEKEEKNYIICSIVGNVDHGKTYLLKDITGTSLTETRNITQKINAFILDNDQKNHIVLLDTPGHETFSSTKEICMDICDLVFFIVSIKDINKESFDEWINYFTNNEINYIILLSKIDNFKSIDEYKKAYFKLGLNNFEEKVYGLKYDKFNYEKNLEEELINKDDLILICKEEISKKENIVDPKTLYILDKERNKKEGIKYFAINLSNKDLGNKNYILNNKLSIKENNKNLCYLKTEFEMSPGDLILLNDKKIAKLKEREKSFKISISSPEQFEKFFIFSSNENKLLALQNIFNKLNLKFSKSFLGKPDTIVEKMIFNDHIEAIFYDVATKFKLPNVFHSDNIYNIEEYLKEKFVTKIEERVINTKLNKFTLYKAKIKAIFNFGKNVVVGCDVYDVIKKNNFVSIVRKEKIIGKNLFISSMRNKSNVITETTPKTEVGFLLKDFTDYQTDDVLHFHSNLI